MSGAIDRIGELSKMNSDLSAPTKEALRRKSGDFANRLHKASLRNNSLDSNVSNTNITKPTVLTRGKRDHLKAEVMPDGFNMNVSRIETEAGQLLAFPLITLSKTPEGRPIIDIHSPKNGYTIVHVPIENYPPRGNYSPVFILADLLLTVDEYDVVTVDGTTIANSEELALFEDLVCAFEGDS